MNAIFYDSTSQLDITRRYRNEASMLGVLFQYATSVSLPKGDTFVAYLNYIIRNRRGLAELLISVKGNAKARSWDKQGSFSHVFFMSIPQVLPLMPKSGELVGEK